MISITNVSPIDAPLIGMNSYAIKINDKLITAFEHNRKPFGLSKCLRDAADAVEQVEQQDFIRFMGKYLPAIKRHVK